MTAPTPLPPGSTIGIIGTGQLGRMLATAAAKLGFHVRTFGPEATPPAARVAEGHLTAAYEDEAALLAFAGTVDVATYEFENIPPKTVRTLMAAGCEVRPGDAILEKCQDRLLEKEFLRSLEIPTAPYVAISAGDEVAPALASLGGQGILKTRRLGYDGKGQVRLGRPSDIGADDAFAAVGEAPSILEGLVPFDLEVSQIAARSAAGDIQFFDMSQNVHRDGILRKSTVPAPLSADRAAEARRLTQKVLEATSYVGVIAVEFFVTDKDGLVANEIAPRVHNSGHWTLEACAAGQFEQHIRAVAGWPLATPHRHSDAVMHNLIGEDVDDWQALAADPDLSLTLYGKGDARPGRKMGHTVQLRK